MCLGLFLPGGRSFEYDLADRDGMEVDVVDAESRYVIITVYNIYMFGAVNVLATPGVSLSSHGSVPGSYFLTRD